MGEGFDYRIPVPGGHGKIFLKDLLDFRKFLAFEGVEHRKIHCVTVCYRRMGQGMGQRDVRTLAHLIFGSKSKKNHRFLIENGGFWVAEAGLEPTTSGL